MFNTRLSAVIACAVIVLFASSSAAFAAEPQASTKPGASKEWREKMASAHERMAACLRSDKSMDVCHQEMMKAAGGARGDHDCGMKGMHEDEEHHAHPMSADRDSPK
jgi:hypothetical protein